VTDTNVFQLSQPGTFADPLTEVLRNGARALLAQAVEAEVAALLGNHADKLTEDGRQRLVRHGHLPEREIMTGIGPVAVRCPRVRNAAQCLLVIIGATPEGKKELVGLIDGVRESAQSWKKLLLDLKRRGLAIGPELAVADGALGFWQAIEEVWPKTRGQRCWVHKTAKVGRNGVEQLLDVCRPPQVTNGCLSRSLLLLASLARLEREFGDESSSPLEMVSCGIFAGSLGEANAPARE
jgi:transposase-like protein